MLSVGVGKRDIAEREREREEKGGERKKSSQFCVVIEVLAYEAEQRKKTGPLYAVFMEICESFARGRGWKNEKT